MSDDLRLVIELHSLARYPPIAVDEDAAWRLTHHGLVTRIPSPGSRRYHTTEAGLAELRRTYSLCSIGHCPCKGESMHANDVAKVVAKAVADFT